MKLFAAVTILICVLILCTGDAEAQLLYKLFNYNPQTSFKVEPLTDIFETENEIVIQCDLPGSVAPDVYFEGNQLKISSTFDSSLPFTFENRKCNDQTSSLENSHKVGNENIETSSVENERETTNQVEDKSILVGSYLMKERPLNPGFAYEKVLKFYTPIDHIKSEAKFENGVLTIIIPKLPTNKIQIEIN